jgi:hypothetical protein
MPDQTLVINADPAAAALDACRRHGVKFLVYAIKDGFVPNFFGRVNALARRSDVKLAMGTPPRRQTILTAPVFSTHVLCLTQAALSPCRAQKQIPDSSVNSHQ